MDKFKQYLVEAQEGVLNLDSKVLFRKDKIAIINTKHGIDRIGERNQLDIEQLKTLFDRIIDKAKKLGSDVKDTILFYSKSLKQGIVTAYDKINKAIRIITFLPRNKHFAKPGTDEVIVEGIKYSNFTYIEIY